MYKKMCDRCCRPSYSASQFGKWFCPVCQKDLSDQKAWDAEAYTFTAFNFSDHKTEDTAKSNIEKYI